jgi:hypothetical protein
MLTWPRHVVLPGLFLRNPGGVSAVGELDQGSRKRRARMSAASASSSVANWSALVSSTSMMCPMPCAPGLNLIRNPFPAGVVLCSIQRYSAFTIGRSQMVSGCIMDPLIDCVMDPLIRQAVSVLPQTLRSSRLDPTFPEPVSHAGGHRGDDFQSLMDANEILVHGMKRGHSGAWFSAFLEKAFASRVKPRIDMFRAPSMSATTMHDAKRPHGSCYRTKHRVIGFRKRSIRATQRPCVQGRV